MIDIEINRNTMLLFEITKRRELLKYKNFLNKYKLSTLFPLIIKESRKYF